MIFNYTKTKMMNKFFWNIGYKLKLSTLFIVQHRYIKVTVDFSLDKHELWGNLDWFDTHTKHVNCGRQIT